MADSIAKQVKYLRQQTDGQARVMHAGGTRSALRWILRCRYCSTPNPDGGEPIKIAIEAPNKPTALAKWLAHEATTAHQIERDRTLGSEPRPRR